MNEFLNEWRNLQRALNMHMILENNGFFQLLDSVGNSAVSEAGLKDEHKHDVTLQENVDKAISEGDESALKQTFEMWSEDHIKHLIHEEEIMMPIIPKTGKNCVEHGLVINEHLFSAIESMDEFDWTLNWILEKLNRANNEGQPADVMVRVFVWGLHYCADNSQWQRWLPIVKNGVSQDLYQQLVNDFCIERPGRVGAVTDLKDEFSYLPEDGPRPMPFAVMRNTHEALRSSINEMSNLLEVKAA